MPEAIGSLLNARYRLDAEMGRGGMGIVYRAHDMLLERDVAVKLLSTITLGTEGRARFLREAQAAAVLNHPNIVTVHDVGEADGLPFIVMELMEGPSLYEQPPAGLDRIVVIAQQVCAALEHAHTNGIIHRDLKPENMLLAPDPGTGADSLAKLVDFGLARSMASRLTSEGAIVGTAFYLAPELALGQACDGRADLYALGVMLYELTTGVLPFTGDEPLAVISQHLHAPVVPPRAKNAEIPPALDALIVRLMSKSPEDRPSSAAEVLQALGATDILDPDAPVTRELSVLERIERGRLVGREREVAQTRALWQKAAGGEGQTLLVSGEPGIGKTRLVRELATQVRVSGGRVLAGECYAEGIGPYAPFAQILQRAFEDGTEDGYGLPDFVLADLLILSPALRLRYPGLPANPALDPKAEQLRLFENVVAFCQALCDRSPLLLVLEDAHWADSGSLALLRHLARRTRRQPVMLVATYRETELDTARPLQEALADLNRERLATRLKLSRLDSAGTGAMLAALFAEEITPEFVDGIFSETEGNPFFIEEVCRALVESGELCFSDGRWQRPSMEELQVPQSVRVVIQSRVGRLPADCQELLRLAAALGREFEYETLAHVRDYDEETLIDSLECALRAQVIEEVVTDRDVTFSFTHGLIQATLVASMSALRRRRLHRRVANAIEQLRPDNYEALAYHYSLAGDEDQALTYHTRAGERASAAYANAEAEGHLRAALDLAEADADRAHLLAELGLVLDRQSRYSEAIDAWQEAIAVQKALGDTDAVAQLYARVGGSARRAYGDPRSLALCREGLLAVAGAPATQGLALLLHETARACYFNGLPDEAAALRRQALAMAEQLNAVEVQVRALSAQAGPWVQPLGERVAALTSAAQLAESAGLLLQAVRMHQSLGVNLGFLVGDFGAAREHFQRAAELCRQRGDTAAEAFCLRAANGQLLSQGAFSEAEEELLELQGLLDAYPETDSADRPPHDTHPLLQRYRGDVTEAVGQLRSYRERAHAAGDLQGVMWYDTWLAEALWEMGEEAEAEDICREAISIGEQGLFPPIKGYCELSAVRSRRGEIRAAHHLLSKARDAASELGTSALCDGWVSLAEAHLAVAQGDWTQAWASFESTVGSWARIGYRWYRAGALREWAEAHLVRGRPGDRERARDLLCEAAAEFEAMGVSKYAKRVKERLERLGVGSSKP
jgi:tetratricopeptide (TPR) repeat protein